MLSATFPSKYEEIHQEDQDYERSAEDRNDFYLVGQGKPVKTIAFVAGHGARRRDAYRKLPLLRNVFILIDREFSFIQACFEMRWQLGDDLFGAERRYLFYVVGVVVRLEEGFHVVI